MREGVLGNAFVDLVLVAIDLTPQFGDVEFFRRGGRIEDAIVDVGVVSDGLEDERQLA